MKEQEKDIYDIDEFKRLYSLPKDAYINDALLEEFNNTRNLIIDMAEDKNLNDKDFEKVVKYSMLLIDTKNCKLKINFMQVKRDLNIDILEKKYHKS